MSQSTNLPPVADAGGDVTAALGAAVKLDGSGSSGPDGDELSYAWEQTGGPGVTLADEDTATLSFEAPGEPGELAFRLTVSDPGGLADSDEATVTVTANPVHHVPFLPLASHPDRQGLVRVINRSAEPGRVSIVAFDDEGMEYGPLTLRIGANADNVYEVTVKASDERGGTASLNLSLPQSKTTPLRTRKQP